MKNRLLSLLVGLTLFQTFFTDFGKVSAENAVPDTLSWKWEVSSTVSTRTKTCTFEFSDNLLVNWGDGVTEWIPDSLSSKAITHVYTVQANYDCTAVGVGISYFKADSRRVLSLDVSKAPGLIYLSCTSNQISVLNLKANVLLTSLYCGSNSIKVLELSRNQKLQTLTCSDNQLNQLDFSALPVLKKVTCHTNPLERIKMNPAGALSYLSCSTCSLTAESLDSIFIGLPLLSAVSTSKNLFVLNNPGSSSCHSEVAAAKNWTLDRVITQSSFYMPSVSCKMSDSIQANVFLKNTAAAIAFEMDVLIPEGFMLDTLRSTLSTARKGQHLLSIARSKVNARIFKIMAYSLKSKDSFSGTDGSLLELYFKAPAEMKTYTLDIQKALLLDTLTNTMDLSITDGQMIVGATSLTGDANGDAQVDVTDIVNLVAFINGRHPAGVDSTAIDIDGNGQWNVADITKLVLIINSAGTTLKSASTVNDALTLESLQLYHAGEVQSGNHFYVRQSAQDSSCLEVCLDNVETVQAFQTDLFLPEGLTVPEGQFLQNTERNPGQNFSIHQFSSNGFRLLSYDLKPDAAFSGKSGVLARIQLQGASLLPDGIYPVVLQKAVLTGMDLKAVASKSYDALLTINNASMEEESISFGTDANSRLWIKGPRLTEVEIWDMAGKRMVHQLLGGTVYFSITLPKGNYIVRACAGGKKVSCKKVAVK